MSEDRRIANAADPLRRWIGLAPPALVLTVCVTMVGGLGAWVWVIAGEVSTQKAIAAVAATQAAVAAGGQQDIEQQVNRLESSVSQRIAQQQVTIDGRLSRIEDKMDRIMDRLMELQVKEMK